MVDRKRKWESKYYHLARPYLKDLLAIETVLQELGEGPCSINVENETVAAKSLQELIGNNAKDISPEKLKLVCHTPYLSVSIDKGTKASMHAADMNDLRTRGAFDRIDLIMNECQAPRIIRLIATPSFWLWLSAITFLLASGLYLIEFDKSWIVTSAAIIYATLYLAGFILGFHTDRKGSLVHLVDRNDYPNFFRRNRDRLFVDGIIAVFGILVGKLL